MLKGFNEKRRIGAAHFERGILFDCNEDCVVSVSIESAGAPGASVRVLMAEPISADPGGPPRPVFDIMVDLSTVPDQFAGAFAYRTGYVIEARSFGIDEVAVTMATVVSQAASPSVVLVR